MSRLGCEHVRYSGGSAGLKCHRTRGFLLFHSLPLRGLGLSRVLPAVRPSRCVLVQMGVGVELEYHVGGVNFERGEPQVQGDGRIGSYSTREPRLHHGSCSRWIFSGFRDRPLAKDLDSTDQVARRCGEKNGTLVHQVNDRMGATISDTSPAGSRTALTDIDNREDWTWIAAKAHW